MRKMLAALTASALVAAPLTAQQAWERSSAPGRDASQLAADSSLFFLLGIAAVAAGVILLQEDEEGVPVSA